MITSNNLYVHTVEHLGNMWREKSATSYFELPIEERMKFAATTVIPAINNTNMIMTEFQAHHTAIRPTTAEALAVPTYAAQLGLRPLGIFR